MSQIFILYCSYCGGSFLLSLIVHILVFLITFDKIPQTPIMYLAWIIKNLCLEWILWLQNNFEKVCLKLKKIGIIRIMKKPIEQEPYMETL